MSDDLTDELRGWGRHEPDEHYSERCPQCGFTRMPCDWNQLVDDVEKAADEIDRLRTELDWWKRSRKRPSGHSEHLR